MGAAVIGNVPSLEVTDYSGDSGNCSSWSVVTGFSNGTDVTATTTQQQVFVSTQVRSIYLGTSTVLRQLCKDLLELHTVSGPPLQYYFRGFSCFFRVRLTIDKCLDFANLGARTLYMTLKTLSIVHAVFPTVKVDGGFLYPGTPYYVRVSSINSVGVGEAQEAETQEDCGDVDAACSPRAPPSPPVDAKVSALTSRIAGSMYIMA